MDRDWYYKNEATTHINSALNHLRSSSQLKPHFFYPVSFPFLETDGAATLSYSLGLPRCVKSCSDEVSFVFLSNKMSQEARFEYLGSF